MKVTDEEAAQAKALLQQYEVEQKAKRAEKMIPCEACGGQHQIGKLDAINTHWYVKPSGCTDGDYWVEGEWHFVCPDTGVRNRLMFWDGHDAMDAGVNAQAVFKLLFRAAFKSMTPEHEHDGLLRSKSYRWVNNDYIDKHRREWGLPEWIPGTLGKVVTND